MALPFVNHDGAAHGNAQETEDLMFPNAAGIDVGASSHWVAVPSYLAEQAQCDTVRSSAR